MNEKNEKIDTTSAKKSSDGISTLIQTIISNLGDKNSQGNAGTIYNILKMFV